MAIVYKHKKSGEKFIKITTPFMKDPLTGEWLKGVAYNRLEGSEAEQKLVYVEKEETFEQDFDPIEVVQKTYWEEKPKKGGEAKK
jgi:hypothetical protein